jgi:diguanylate cyclase (GGDEF)-like protein/PAS domain S-box-containing protein
MNTLMPTNESARLNALRRYRQMDSPPEEAFDDLAATAAAFFHVSVAAITLVDDAREWRKSLVGSALSEPEAVRSCSFSEAAIMRPDVLWIPDARVDARFAENPFVAGPDAVRFCAAASLVTEDGIALGALLVMGRDVREFSESDAGALRRLARQTVTLLELKRTVAQLGSIVEKRKRVTRALETRTRDLTTQKLGLEARRQELEAGKHELEIRNEDIQDGVMLYEYASQRFLELFQGLPVACFCYDSKGRIFEWNRAFEAQYGLGAEATLLKEVWDAICRPEEAEAMKDLVAEVFRGRTFEGMERSDLRADGSLCHVLSNSFPIRQGDGTVIGGICANVDITQRKQAQEALRQSEERYRQTFRRHGAVKLLVDAVTDEIVDANPAACAFYGWSFEQLRGRTMAGILAFDDGRVGAEAALATAEQRPYHNLRHRLASGEVRDVEVHTGPVHIDGRLHHYSIVHDVTERRLAEMARDESELRFRSVTQSANDAIITVTQDDCIISWNMGARKIFGYSEREVLGCPLDMILPGLYSKVAPGDKSKVLNRTVEMSGRCKDGSDIPLELSLATWSTEQGTFFSAVIRDITERKRYEKQLQEQMEQINSYSAEMEAHKSRLEAINRKLEELSKLDGMTGLKNRRAFEERMELEFARAMRYAMPLSLLLLDVDDLKAYNDAFGHPAGDEALKMAAQVMQSSTRGVDLVARYGGEEFIIILPHTNSEGACTIADRIRAATENATWPVRPLTISVGVATLTPATMDIPAMIEQADWALCASKKAGKNRVTHAAALESSETIKA